MSRIYLSQELVDECMTIGRMQLEGEFLRVDGGVSFWIDPAVLFEAVDSGAADPHEVLGCVKTAQELAQMGAEHFDRSVLVGEVAYTVRPGFLAVPVGPDGVPSALDHQSWSEVTRTLGDLAA